MKNKKNKNQILCNKLELLDLFLNLCSRTNNK